MHKRKRSSKKTREQAAIRQRKHRAKLDEQIRRLWRTFHRHVWKQQGSGAVYLPGETLFDDRFYDELTKNHLARSTISEVTPAIWWDISPDIVLTDSLFSVRLSLLEPIPEETKEEVKAIPAWVDPSAIRFWLLLCVKERAMFTFIRLDETRVLLIGMLLVSPHVQNLRLTSRDLVTTKDLNQTQLEPVVDQIIEAHRQLFRRKIAERLGPQLNVILPEWQSHDLSLVVPGRDNLSKGVLGFLHS